MIGRGRLAALATAALLLAGCGAAPTSTVASQVPTLASVLTEVDSSLAHHQYTAARTTLTRLIADTRAAQKDQSISSESASRILSAARQLLALLPHTAPAPYTPPTQFTAPSASPSPKPKKTASPTPVKPQPSPTVAPTPAPSTPAPSPSTAGTTAPAAAVVGSPSP